MTHRFAGIAERIRWPGVNPVALRRGARAAIVIPLAFFVARLVVGSNLNALIFIIFGAFALLVMADFGGPLWPRTVAYLGMVLTGAVLVAIGTLASATALIGAAAMLVIGFALAFAAVFGSYAAIGRTGLLLAFVISITLPAPPSAIPGRVAGWVVAGLFSTLAALLLWPRPETAALRTRAADALGRVADAVADRDSLAAAPDAVRAARAEYGAAARRPAGLSRRDRAYFEMFAELDQIIDLLQAPFGEPGNTVRPCIAEADRLRATVKDALRSSADALRGGGAPDLRALEQARREHRAALDRWATEELQAGRPGEEVLDGLDHDQTLRVTSWIALATAGNAVIAAGQRLDAPDVRMPVTVPTRPGPTGILVRVWRTIRAHMEPRSAVLHNSLRVAIGLAASVWLARTLGFSHSFWVVLGTLQVLRTSALGTGRTILQALIGTALGVLVGGAIASLVGTNTVILWAIVPFSVFFAAYAANTIGFVLSQAAFTVNLIVIFNLIAPAGWQVGLVRIEDVVAGAAVSVAVGVLLWPRGARQDLAGSLSSFYRAAAAYLGAAFDGVLGPEMGGHVYTLRRQAVRARERAGESLQELLAEPASEHLEPRTAAALVEAGNQAMLAADGLTLVATDLGYHVAPGAGDASPLRTQVQAVLTRLSSLATRLDAKRSASVDDAPVTAQALRTATLGGLEGGHGSPPGDRSALAMVIAGEWAQYLARVEAGIEQPVSATVAAAKIPWWR